MDCALWLNRRKIRSAEEIPDNLDIASLRGYFIAGSLVEWLYEHDGALYADKLAKVPPDFPDLNAIIAEIFAGKPVTNKTLGKNAAKTAVLPSNSTNPGSGPPFRASWKRGSFPTFFTSGSFKFGSFSITSGGFHEWEWEWLNRFLGQYGSFVYTSYGSFVGLERLLEIIRGYGGSGSFVGLYKGSFGEFNKFGSFSRFFGKFANHGSFGNLELPPWLNDLPDLPIEDEYDLIMFAALLHCPLDGFGYGIHII